MSNPTDVQPLAGQPGLPPFPTWPPPSGGAPVTKPELGPILSPFPYGKGQGANIATAPPAPLKSATYFPKKMPPLNGQNQPQVLPPWPYTKFNVLPHKADPFFSRIPSPGAPMPTTPVFLTPPVQPKQFAPAEQWPPSGGYPVVQPERGPLLADPSMSKLT